MSHIRYNFTVKDIKVFQTNTGKKPFNDWLHEVKDRKDRARIRRRIDRLQMGHYGDFKKIHKDLYELRLFFGPGYRVYFTEQGDEIVLLLLGGDKKTQSRDIEKAERYLKTVLNAGGEI